MGFIRRRDNTHYSGVVTWSPRLTNSDTIRNFSVGTRTDYYEGGTGEVETREQQIDFGVQFENNGSASFSIDQTFDRLREETRIRGVQVLTGDCAYRRYSTSFRTDSSEIISGSGGVSWGEFWDGTLKSFNAGMGLKPHYRMTIALNYSRNLVNLSQGSTTTDLAGVRFVYGFTPRSFFDAFFAIQRGDRGDQHEHPVQHHVSAAERSLPGI